MKNVKTLLICAAALLFCALPACAPKETPRPKEDNKKTAAANPKPAKPGEYIIMEKTLADLPRRPGTSMKIIVPRTPAGDKAALETAFNDARRQDPTLKMVIIWAYRTRGEINAGGFTLGKLEWSESGMDVLGKNKLNPNPKIEIISQ
jgi:hypothetical protein